MARDICGNSRCGNPSFCAACQRADEKRRRQPEPERLRQLRRLMADDVSLERAYSELNRRHCAAASTVEALMYALSIRNTAALREPKIQDWVAQLSEDHADEIGGRLQRLNLEVMRKRAPTAPPWTADEVKQLLRAKA